MALPTLDHREDELFATAIPQMLAGRIGSAQSNLRPLAFSYVRLSARVLLAYRRAKAGYESGDLCEMICATGDLEDCFIAIHRALEHLVKMRSHGLRTTEGDTIALRGGDFSILRDSSRATIAEFRNAIVHMYGDSAGGRTPPGVPTAPIVSDGEIRLLQTTLSVADFTDWVNQIAKISLFLCRSGVIDYREAV